MTERIDPLLTLFIGAGWPEKRIKEVLLCIQESDLNYTIRRHRLIKKALGKVQNSKSLIRRTISEEVDQALKLLRSLGQYSETEIIEHLAGSPDADLFRSPPVTKGGLKSWLEAFAIEVGSERMMKVVGTVRNQLIHAPTPSWTIKDVK